MGLTSTGTGLLLSRLSDAPQWGEVVVVSVIAMAMTRLFAERQRMYRLPVLIDPLLHLPRLGLGVAAGAVASGAALLLLHRSSATYPYLLTQPLAWALASGAGLLALRSGVAWRLQVLGKAGRLSTRVALVGANAASMKFVRDSAGDSSVSIIGIYDDRATRLSDTGLRDWMRGDIAALVSLARREPVDAVLIALPLEATQRIAQVRRRLAGIATDIFLTPDVAVSFYDGAKFTPLGQTSVLSVSTRPLKDWPAFKKGLFDRVSSAVFILLTLPLLLVIAAIIKLDSRGPVLFRQEREGLNGVPFTMLKFRTMFWQPQADQSVQATQGDRRVTRSGYWLRRFSLDELPQLLNVLRGEMSVVGPRPHLATTRAGSRLFSEVVPHYQARHRMKPGLTGWAQVQGLRGETRTERDIADRVQQDLYYIDHWSLGLDLRIIVRTIMQGDHRQQQWAGLLTGLAQAAVKPATPSRRRCSGPAR